MTWPVSSMQSTRNHGMGRLGSSGGHFGALGPRDARLWLGIQTRWRMLAALRLQVDQRLPVEGHGWAAWAAAHTPCKSKFRSGHSPLHSNSPGIARHGRGFGAQRRLARPWDDLVEVNDGLAAVLDAGRLGRWARRFAAVWTCTASTPASAPGRVGHDEQAARAGASCIPLRHA